MHGRDGAFAAALRLSRERRYPSICTESEGKDVERLSHIFCACGGARARELWTVDADRLSDMVSARARGPLAQIWIETERERNGTEIWSVIILLYDYVMKLEREASGD